MTSPLLLRRQPIPPEISLRKTSIDKKIHFLLLEGVHPSAEEVIRAAGYTNIDSVTGTLPDAELKARLADAHFLGIRSRTQLTKDVFAHAPKLAAVGCFCIGTNQVDLTAARQRGIAVFNAPYSNTRSVAELVLAEALGMKVVFFDGETKLPLGNARQILSLHELLAISDVVSLHVPETRATRWLMGANEMAAMKQGSVLINASRGSVVDIHVLSEALARRKPTSALKSLKSWSSTATTVHQPRQGPSPK